MLGFYKALGWALFTVLGYWYSISNVQWVFIKLLEVVHLHYFWHFTDVGLSKCCSRLLDVLLGHWITFFFLSLVLTHVFGPEEWA